MNDIIDKYYNVYFSPKINEKERTMYALIFFQKVLLNKNYFYKQPVLFEDKRFSKKNIFLFDGPRNLTDLFNCMSFENKHFYCVKEHLFEDDIWCWDFSFGDPLESISYADKSYGSFIIYDDKIKQLYAFNKLKSNPYSYLFLIFDTMINEETNMCEICGLNNVIITTNNDTSYKKVFNIDFKKNIYSIGSQSYAGITIDDIKSICNHLK